MLTRRGALRLAVGAFAAVVAEVGPLSYARALGGPRLFVFVPTAMGVFAFQRLLAQSMPSIQVVAFGRYRDFETSLAEGPDGVLTLEPILRAKQLRPTVVGNNGSGAIEKYVLISVGLPGLSVLTGAGSALAPQIRRLGPQVSQEMGVTRWA